MDEIVAPSKPPVVPPVAEANDVPAAAERLSIRGLHHATMIASNLDRTVAFYRDLLGMTLLESTYNADDPGARHFVFGDSEGSPGSILTFMEYPNLPAGEVGIGSTHHFALRVGSPAALNAWIEHLRAHHVQCTDAIDRGRFSSTYLRDPDGHIVELASDS